MDDSSESSSSSSSSSSLDLSLSSSSPSSSGSSLSSISSADLGSEVMREETVPLAQLSLKAGYEEGSGSGSDDSDSEYDDSERSSESDEIPTQNQWPSPVRVQSPISFPASVFAQESVQTVVTPDRKMIDYSLTIRPSNSVNLSHVFLTTASAFKKGVIPVSGELGRRILGFHGAWEQTKYAPSDKRLEGFLARIVLQNAPNVIEARSQSREDGGDESVGALVRTVGKATQFDLLAIEDSDGADGSDARGKVLQVVQLNEPYVNSKLKTEMLVYGRAEGSDKIYGQDLLSADGYPRAVARLRIPFHSTDDMLYSERVSFGGITNDLQYGSMLTRVEDPMDPRIKHYILLLFDEDNSLEIALQFSAHSSTTTSNEQSPNRSSSLALIMLEQIKGNGRMGGTQTNIEAEVPEATIDRMVQTKMQARSIQPLPASASEAEQMQRVGLLRELRSEAKTEYEQAKLRSTLLKQSKPSFASTPAESSLSADAVEFVSINANAFTRFVKSAGNFVADKANLRATPGSVGDLKRTGVFAEMHDIKSPVQISHFEDAANVFTSVPFSEITTKGVAIKVKYLTIKAGQDIRGKRNPANLNCYLVVRSPGHRMLYVNIQARYPNGIMVTQKDKAIYITLEEVFKGHFPDVTARFLFDADSMVPTKKENGLDVYEGIAFAPGTTAALFRFYTDGEDNYYITHLAFVAAPEKFRSRLRNTPGLDVKKTIEFDNAEEEEGEDDGYNDDTTPAPAEPIPTISAAELEQKVNPSASATASPVSAVPPPPPTFIPPPPPLNTPE